MRVDPAALLLGEAEQRYLRQVSRALRGLPRHEVRSALASAREHLEERPAAPSWAALVADLGEPDAYARGLLDSTGVLPASRYERLARSPLVWAAIAATMLLGVVAVGAWRRWTDDPGVRNSCAGVADPTDADRTRVVERVENSLGTEIRIAYEPDRPVTLLVCLTAERSVEITGIRLPVPPRSLARPVAVVELVGRLRRPFTPTRLEHGPALQLGLVVGFDDCEHYGEASASLFDAAEVSYRDRGRTRTTTIDLVATYAFVSPGDERCPERGR